MDHYTVFAWFLYLCDDDRALVAMRFVEVDKVFERVLANDIGVENKERRVVLP